MNTQKLPSLKHAKTQGTSSTGFGKGKNMKGLALELDDINED